MNPYKFFTRTIARKIGSAFSLVLLMFAAAVGIVLMQVSAQHEANTHLIRSRTPTAMAAESVLSGLYISSSAYRGYMLTSDDRFRVQREHAWSERIYPGLARLHKLAPDWNSPEDSRLMAGLEKLGPEIEHLQQQAMDLNRKDPQAAAAMISNQIAPANEAFQAPLEELAKANITALEDEGESDLRFADRARWIVLSLLFAALTLGTTVACLAVRTITRQLADLARTAQSLADGDLTVHLEQSSNDEVGRVFGPLARLTESWRAAIGQTSVAAQGVAASSEELSAVSSQMGANAEETSAQSNVVAAAAEQVSKSVRTVVTGAEEMMASIKEIAKSSTDAARVASQAVRVAETTNATVGKLGESSAEIGKVIKVITSIAQQTNLLALNATIEAARAGEAGRSFAVVANEVKELAKETAKATEDISQKIEAIQTDTRGAVEAIGEIGAIIHQIYDIQNTIATAVEEQSVTTSEMGRNLTEAAQGTSEIAQNISGVASTARSTAEGASHSQRAASELARMAAELQRLVSQFDLESRPSPVDERGNLKIVSRRAA